MRHILNGRGFHLLISNPKDVCIFTEETFHKGSSSLSERSSVLQLASQLAIAHAYAGDQLTTTQLGDGLF